MGNTHTSTAATGGAETSCKQRQQKQRQLQEQQRKNGVLIPPAFVATIGIPAAFGGGDGGDGGDNGSSSSSSSIQALADRQQRETLLAPSLVDWLLQTSTGYVLLTEYMRPGLYCRIPTGGEAGTGGGGGKGGSGGNGQFLLALDLSKVSSNPSPLPPPPPPPTNNALGSSTGGLNLPPPPPPSGIGDGGGGSFSFLSLSHSLTSSIFNSTRPDLLDLRLFVPMPTSSSSSSSGSSNSKSRPSLLVSTKAIPRTTLTAQLEAATTTTIDASSESGRNSSTSNSWVNVTTRLLPLGKLLPKGMPVLVDDMVVGAWVNASSLQKILAVTTGGTAAAGGGSNGNGNNVISASPSNDAHIHLQAAAASSTMDAVVGIQAKIPLFDAPTSSSGSSGSSNNKSNDRYLPEAIETLVSWNLNGGGGGGGGRGDIAISKTTPTPPPLWLTFTHQYSEGGAVDSSPSVSSSSWTLNLSQVFTYDRVNLNLLDDRDIPWVRNHLGWVVQVDSHNSWAAGATWQLNRAVALKAVLEQKQQQQQTSSTQLNTALILKRWKQPRMVLSVLNRFDLQTGRGSFVGLGLEVETLAALGGTAYASSTNLPSGDSVPPPPPTKIQVRNATTKRVQTRFLDVKS